jgi:FAD dependent oxidoreductase TIGR03364
MIWPVGQPAGPQHELALRSREIWLDVARHARIGHRDTGSLHVAYRNDEADVGREFAEIAPGLGYDCEWLDRERVLDRTSAVVPNGLIGALWSRTELTVDPRSSVARLPEFLNEWMGVQLRFGSAVRAVDLPGIDTSTERWRADAAIICSGDDFATLYPALLADSGLIRCKLQMMRTGPQPGNWHLGPSLAAGLTLRFYPAFRVCTTLPRLEQRIARETPAYDRWGIHVLVSQTDSGELTIGDSHEYGNTIDFADKPIIDDLVLNYARSFLRVPDFTIAQRWHGVYAKHPEKPYVVMEPERNVRIVTGTGGSGMTLSFGIGEQTVRKMGL